MQNILILLAAAEHEPLTASGQSLLRDFHSSYQLRLASAQTTPDFVKELVTNFQKAGGQLIICVAAPQDRLAALVATLVTLPVLNVAVGGGPVSLENLPGPLPLATIGQGAEGFLQAALFALQVLALQDPKLQQNLGRHRHSLEAQMIAVDTERRVFFDG